MHWPLIAPFPPPPAHPKINTSKELLGAGTGSLLPAARGSAIGSPLAGAGAFRPRLRTCARRCRRAFRPFQADQRSACPRLCRRRTTWPGLPYPGSRGGRHHPTRGLASPCCEDVPQRFGATTYRYTVVNGETLQAGRAAARAALLKRELDNEELRSTRDVRRAQWQAGASSASVPALRPRLVSLGGTP